MENLDALKILQINRTRLQIVASYTLGDVWSVSIYICLLIMHNNLNES